MTTTTSRFWFGALTISLLGCASGCGSNHSSSKRPAEEAGGEQSRPEAGRSSTADSGAANGAGKSSGGSHTGATGQAGASGGSPDGVGALAGTTTHTGGRAEFDPGSAGSMSDTGGATAASAGHPGHDGSGGSGTSGASTGSGGQATTGGGSAGTSGTTQTGGSAAAACTTVDDCIKSMDPCLEPVIHCVAGACRQPPRLERVVLPETPDTLGDCQQRVCDGNGAARAEPDDTDVRTGSRCLRYECADGTPHEVPAPVGTACGNNRQCSAEHDCTACSSSGTSCRANNECCTGSCIDETCSDDTCPPGSQSCRGSAIYECPVGGGDPELVEECGSGEYCDPNTVACISQACTPGELGCSGTALELCNVYGSGPANAGIDCASAGGICQAGQCLASVCTPNAYACTGQRLDRCSADGTGWTTAATCTDGQRCAVDAGQCVDLTCTPNSSRCAEDDIAVRCDSEGASETSEDCAADSLVCVAGECTSGQCTPGQRFCVGKELYECGTDGTPAESPILVCGEGEGCDARFPTCLPAICEPGVQSCESGSIWRCDGQGIGKELAQHCNGSCDEQAVACDECTTYGRYCKSHDGEVWDAQTGYYHAVSGDVYRCAGKSDSGAIWSQDLPGVPLKFFLAEPCSDSQVCAGGYCQEKRCEPGRRDCSSLLAVEECQQEGYNYTYYSCWDHGGYCSQGMCLPALITEPFETTLADWDDNNVSISSDNKGSRSAVFDSPGIADAYVSRSLPNAHPTFASWEWQCTTHCFFEFIGPTAKGVTKAIITIEVEILGDDHHYLDVTYPGGHDSFTGHLYDEPTTTTLSNINWVTRTLDIKMGALAVTGTPFADDVNSVTSVRFSTPGSMELDTVFVFE